MEIKKYLSLLSNGEFEKAERIRLEGIPNRLIKFVGLDDSKGDEKKLVSLNQNEIWFAQKDNLNDPYEYKGMFLDRNRMEKAGYPTEIIDKYETLFDFSDYGITCLSNNSVDYLPMWAYYTNNHRGFCVEYEVIKKNCIHEVLYEPERIKVGSLIFECRDAVKNAIITGKRDKADFFSKLFLQNLFIKAESWKHEKEYRIVYPLDNGTGQNVSVSKLGMRTSRIIAGINCSEKNIVRLNEISNNLGLGNVYISKIHPEKYTIDVKRLVDCICKKSRN